MTVDRRVLAYAWEHWVALVDLAAAIGDSPAATDAEGAVLAALAWAADSEQRAALPAAELDRVVRRRLVRRCAGRPVRRSGVEGGDASQAAAQVMQVIDDVDRPVEVETPEVRVRRAVRALPPRQRVAVVLLHGPDRTEDPAASPLDPVAPADPAEPADAIGARTARVADLLGATVAAVRDDAVAGLARLAGGLGLDPPAGPIGSSRVERLVAGALASSPPVVPVTADPAVALEHAAGRRRRRQVGGVAAASILVLAALGAAFTQSTHPRGGVITGGATPSRSPSSPVSPRPAVSDSFRAFPDGIPSPATPGVQRVGRALSPVLVSRSSKAFATAVTAGGGYVFTLEVVATKKGTSSFVVQRQASSDHVTGRFRIPAADNDIAYGNEELLAWSSNDAPKRTVITTLEGPTDFLGQSITTEHYDPSVASANAAFTQGEAWLTEPAAGVVAPYGDGFASGRGHHALPGARYIAPSGPRHVIVGVRHGAIRELPGDHVVDASLTRSHRLTLVAPAPGYALWLARGRQLLYQPGATGPVQLRLTLPHRVFAVVGDPSGGVYVALHSNSPVNHDPYLVYFSARSLAEGDRRPSAQVDGALQVESMVADPAGGVVYTTNQGSVIRWDPVG